VRGVGGEKRVGRLNKMSLEAMNKFSQSIKFQSWSWRPLVALAGSSIINCSMKSCSSWETADDILFIDDRLAIVSWLISRQVKLLA
jgi:hypothetical protein